MTQHDNLNDIKTKWREIQDMIKKEKGYGFKNLNYLWIIWIRTSRIYVFKLDMFFLYNNIMCIKIIWFLIVSYIHKLDLWNLIKK